MERVRVTRVSVKLRDDDLATNRLRGVGFRAVSSSGWEGPVRIFREDAARDVRAHRAQAWRDANPTTVPYSTTKPVRGGSAL